MRKLTVTLKSWNCGQIRKLETITGELPDLQEQIRARAPYASGEQIKKALIDSLFSENLIWLPQHQLAVQIMEIELPDMTNNKPVQAPVSYPDYIPLASR